MSQSPTRNHDVWGTPAPTTGVVGNQFLQLGSRGASARNYPPTNLRIESPEIKSKMDPLAPGLPKA